MWPIFQVKIPKFQSFKFLNLPRGKYDNYERAFHTKELFLFRFSNIAKYGLNHTKWIEPFHSIYKLFLSNYSFLIDSRIAIRNYYNINIVINFENNPANAPLYMLINVCAHRQLFAHYYYLAQLLHHKNCLRQYFACKLALCAVQDL